MIPMELTLEDLHYIATYAYGFTGTKLPSYWVAMSQEQIAGYDDGVGDRKENVALPFADFNCSYHCKRMPGTYISAILDPINPQRSKLPAGTPSKIFVVGLWFSKGVYKQWKLQNDRPPAWEPVDIPF